MKVIASYKDLLAVENPPKLNILETASGLSAPTRLEQLIHNAKTLASYESDTTAYRLTFKSNVLGPKSAELLPDTLDVKLVKDILVTLEELWAATHDEMRGT